MVGRGAAVGIVPFCYTRSEVRRDRMHFLLARSPPSLRSKRDQEKEKPSRRRKGELGGEM